MPPAPVETFITGWSDTELCDLLDLPHPDPADPESAENAYVFERAVPLHHADGRVTVGKIASPPSSSSAAPNAAKNAARSPPDTKVVPPLAWRVS